MSLVRTVATGAAGWVLAAAAPVASAESVARPVVLGIARVTSDFGSAVQSLENEPQHVVCDGCNIAGKAAPFIDLPVKKLKINPHVVIPLQEKISGENAPEASPEPPGPEPSGSRDITAAVVRFRLGDWRLSNAARKGLDMAIDRILEIRRTGNVEVKVSGYTCSLGGKSFNDRLAVRRAGAVAEYLRVHGIVVTGESGEGRCCYISEENAAVNRRVEVVARVEGDR